MSTNALIKQHVEELGAVSAMILSLKDQLEQYETRRRYLVAFTNTVQSLEEAQRAEAKAAKVGTPAPPVSPPRADA